MENDVPVQPINSPVPPPPPQSTPVVPNNHKKFPVVVVIILLLLVGGVGIMYLSGKRIQPIATENSTENSYRAITSTDEQNQPTSADTNTNGQAATTYTNTKNGYQILVPADWKAVALGSGSDASASEDTDSVDIQSPNLSLGNVTLSVLSALPEKQTGQAVAIEVFKTNAFTSYTSQTDGMVSRSFYIKLKNGQFLEILTRPVTTSNEQIFESMMDSFELL